MGRETEGYTEGSGRGTGNGERWEGRGGDRGYIGMRGLEGK